MQLKAALIGSLWPGPTRVRVAALLELRVKKLRNKRMKGFGPFTDSFA